MLSKHRYLTVDTLYHQTRHRPCTQNIDISEARVVNLAHTTRNFLHSAEHVLVSPEQEALSFYLSNHLVAKVQSIFSLHQPLNDHLYFLETYHKMMVEKGRRMFYYLLLICTRESRHCQQPDTIYEDILKQDPTQGARFIAFHKKIKGRGSNWVVDYFMTDSPDISLGFYAKSLVYVFKNGHYSSGFGGKAWAEVARCLSRFVAGTYTTELMLDTAFTLCHNNGPIFNKGIFFKNSNKLDILLILDVQRSGQIPNLVNGNLLNYDECAHINDEHRCYFKEVLIHFPEFKDSYVDWFLVESLGSVKSYDIQKKAQTAWHGLPKNIKELPKLKDLMTKENEDNTVFYVMPGTELKEVKQRPTRGYKQ